MVFIFCGINTPKCLKSETSNKRVIVFIFINTQTRLKYLAYKHYNMFKKWDKQSVYFGVKTQTLVFRV